MYGVEAPQGVPLGQRAGPVSHEIGDRNQNETLPLSVEIGYRLLEPPL